MMHKRMKESGAVALFLVIFSALLITTVSVAFIRIMLQNQQQATTDDLSKSALDSAYAGVEDAKRVIVLYRNNCINPDGSIQSSTECTQLHDALSDANNCRTIQDSGIFPAAVGEDEVLVKQVETDKQLQQAYTCVKVTMNTFDYVGTISPGTSRVISLNTDEDFDSITIEWFSQSDLQTVISNSGLPGNTTIDLPASLQPLKLQKLGLWPENRPPIMRAQLIQFGDTFRLSEFDDNDGGKANAAALFLMPSNIPANNTLGFNDDYMGSGPLQAVPCEPNFSTTSMAGSYACRATIAVPNPIGPDNPSSRTAYLRISTIYGGATSYSISLANSGDPVRFKGVQPEIDSTGRANELFRRIKSRVEVGASGVPFVNSAVELARSFCKTFLVTDKEDDFDPGVSCDP